MSNANNLKRKSEGDDAPAPCKYAAMAKAGTTPEVARSPMSSEEQKVLLAKTVSKAKVERWSSPLYYHDYLKLDQVLNAVEPQSRKLGCEAHDEHLFIVIHQVYELWFKQILFEVGSVQKIFCQDYLPEKSVSVIVQRLHRVTEIQRILVEQLTVLETMSPLGFLDFRDLLFPASGFQSVQFRKLENTLGLASQRRVDYAGRGYCTYLSDKHAAEVESCENKENTILRQVEKWLERIPFLTDEKQLEGFDFWAQYKVAVLDMLEHDRKTINENPGTSDEEKKAQLVEVDKSVEHYMSLFDEEKYEARRAKGEQQFSYKALKAALFIYVYQDEPVLHLPFQLLNNLLNIDELLTTWRYRHALMVHRMLGVKIGTGGSSGYMYLRATASRHRIFRDLFNLPTFLIPRHNVPTLPSSVARKLTFALDTNEDV